RPVEAGNETKFDRVGADVENDWNARRRGFSSERRRGAPGRNDHRHLAADQIGCERRQPVILALSPAVFDAYIPVFDIAGVIQALAERGQGVLVLRGGLGVEEPDHRQRRLLRPRRQRPSGCASDVADKFAPSHVGPPQSGPRHRGKLSTTARLDKSNQSKAYAVATGKVGAGEPPVTTLISSRGRERDKLCVPAGSENFLLVTRSGAIW